MANQSNNHELAKKLELLALIEFAKAGVDRVAVRAVTGSLDNNLYSKLKTLFGDKSKK